MITKDQARIIAEGYLKEKNRQYTTISPVEKIAYRENKKIIYGKYEGGYRNVFVVDYGVLRDGEERSEFIYEDITSGEVLYSLNSHGVVEELEDDE